MIDPAIALLLAALDQPASRRRGAAAAAYALVIAGYAARGDEFWKAVNAKVNGALGLEGWKEIDRFRREAWGLHDAAGAIQIRHARTEEALR
jgi:hypothetical protein